MFTREILPLLEGVSLSKMKAATGLSVTMCAKIRQGYVPHARHWGNLRGLGASASAMTHSGTLRAEGQPIPHESHL